MTPTEITIPDDPTAALSVLAGLEPNIARRILSSRQPSTWAVYLGHLRRLQVWLRERGESFRLPMDPSLLMRWLSSLADAGKAASTVRVAAAAVSAIHTTHGHETPTREPMVRSFLAGTARELRANRTVAQADPIMPEDVAKAVAHAMEGPESYHRESLVLTRDLALVLLGFAGGFRRSELARLQVDDLTFEADGDAVVVRLPWMKARYTDEPHERRICAAEHRELCPVSALRTWMAGAHVTSGPVFLAFTAGRVVRLTDHPISGRVVDHAVRKLTRHLLQKVQGRRPHWSAHSLRSGLATAAALAGSPDREIGDHLGHRSPVTTARYIRASRVRRSELTRGLL
jgi:integrase